MQRGIHLPTRANFVRKKYVIIDSRPVATLNYRKLMGIKMQKDMFNVLLKF